MSELLVKNCTDEGEASTTTRSSIPPTVSIRSTLSRSRCWTRTLRCSAGLNPESSAVIVYIPGSMKSKM